MNTRWKTLLNTALTEVIVEQCHGKKILLTLTGGMDTRLILSILLKQKIGCDVYTYHSSKPVVQYFVDKDIRIAKEIAGYYGLVHHVFNGDGSWYETLNRVRDGYDVVVGGGCMSEYFNTLEYNKHSENEMKKNIQQRHVDVINQNNIFAPMLDERVLCVLPDIPRCCKMFSVIQRSLIMMNTPDLLMCFGSTEHSVVREVESRLYRFCLQRGWLI